MSIITGGIRRILKINAEEFYYIFLVLSMTTGNSTEHFIRSITSSLDIQKGIWMSAVNNAISYPAEGNIDCFHVEENSYWFNHRNEILKLVISEHSRGKRFFDIGGGNGFVTKALQDMGFEAWLVEPGYDGIINAKSRGVKNLINATFECAGFESGMLDNIGLFDVLEHIESDQEIIDKIYQATSPGGRIFITVPAYSFLWSDADVNAGHFRRYSRKTARHILERAGFNVLYDTCFFSFLVPLIFILRTIPYRVLKRKKAGDMEEVHNIKWELVSKLINRLCRYEMRKITHKNKILFGSSCLIISEKI